MVGDMGDGKPVAGRCPAAGQPVPRKPVVHRQTDGQSQVSRQTPSQLPDRSVVYVNGVEINYNTNEFSGKNGIITSRNKVVDTLYLLISNHSSVVTRDEIISNIWPDRIASDESVTQIISELRNILKHIGIEREVIRTIPKKGYVFDGEIEFKSQDFTAKNDQGRPHDLKRNRSTRTTPGILVLAMAIGTACYFLSRFSKKSNRNS